MGLIWTVPGISTFSGNNLVKVNKFYCGLLTGEFPVEIKVNF